MGIDSLCTKEDISKKLNRFTRERARVETDRQTDRPTDKEKEIVTTAVLLNLLNSWIS